MLILGASITTDKPKRKPRNVMTFLLLPVLVFIFLMGWSMYWIGDQKRPKKKSAKRKVPPKEDGVTFLPAVYEETPPLKNKQQ